MPIVNSLPRGLVTVCTDTLTKAYQYDSDLTLSESAVSLEHSAYLDSLIHK